MEKTKQVLDEIIAETTDRLQEYFDMQETAQDNNIPNLKEISKIIGKIQERLTVLKKLKADLND